MPDKRELKPPTGSVALARELGVDLQELYHGTINEHPNQVMALEPSFPTKATKHTPGEPLEILANTAAIYLTPDPDTATAYAWADTRPDGVRHGQSQHYEVAVTPRHIEVVEYEEMGEAGVCAALDKDPDLLVLERSSGIEVLALSPDIVHVQRVVDNDTGDTIWDIDEALVEVRPLNEPVSVKARPNP